MDSIINVQSYEKKLTPPSACCFFSYFCSVKMQEIIEQTVDVLRHGGTILYPTDTIWGIGCDARNRDAVERLYAIKERDHTKSMLVLVESGKCKMEGGERPTTFILPPERWQLLLGKDIADNLPAADGSLGIRMPKHIFCQEVISRLGAPLVSTSANLSGRPSPASYDEIEEELKLRVDYCVSPLPEFLSGLTQSSRIVKIYSDGSETVIRP